MKYFTDLIQPWAYIDMYYINMCEHVRAAVRLWQFRDLVLFPE